MMVLSILQQQKHDYGDDPSQMQMSETRGKKTHTHRSFHRTWDSKSLLVCVGFWVFRGFREGFDLVTAAATTTSTTLLYMYYFCCCTPPNNRQHFLLQNL
jgi:hypothetical protein